MNLLVGQQQTMEMINSEQKLFCGNNLNENCKFVT